jgi:hypothetical protein
MVTQQEKLKKSSLRYLELWLLDLFINPSSAPELQDVQWLDKVDYARESQEPPVGTLYRTDKEHLSHTVEGGTEVEMEYKVAFRLEIMITRSDVDADEISWLEEKIEDIVALNLTPTNVTVGGQAHPIQLEILRSDYDTLFDEHDAVDTAVLDLALTYTRELVL